MTKVRIPKAAPVHLEVTSSALVDGGKLQNAQVFNGWDAGGENISPDLSWEGAPSETACYAITCFDPDAPTGSGFWHWAIVNIPANIKSIKAGKTPQGAIEARNDYGFCGYGGACPPHGDGAHRYIFTVYALKEALDIDKNTSCAVCAFNIHALKLAQGSIEVTYERV